METGSRAQLRCRISVMSGKTGGKTGDGENRGRKTGDRRNVPQCFEEWKLANLPSDPVFSPISLLDYTNHRVEESGT